MRDHRLFLVQTLGCMIAALGSSLSTPAQMSTANEWTWMGGSSTLNPSGYQAADYGSLGTPAAGNTPGSRWGAVSWTDKDGHFWLFGGEASINGLEIQEPNDLWEFDTASNEWTWEGGGLPSSCVVNECGQPGIYGSLGTPSAANIPGSRNGAVAWSDKNGHLWLYGGDGFDSNGVIGVLNDMWEFDPSTKEWTWMGGSSAVPSANTGQPGVYGTKGVPAAGNNPGGRWMTSGWTDRKGYFWLFAGWGYDANGANGSPNNLWRFNPATNEWAWISGSSTITANGFQPGVYGTLGQPASDNLPGSRANAVSWTDLSGNLWLFGGNGRDADSNSGYLNDVWQFNPSTNEWTWMGGSSVLSCAALGQGYCYQPGSYGTLGIAASGNIPASSSAAAGWTDTDGNFWLFSGMSPYEAGNDFWEFHPTTNEWEWMGGSDIGYGTGSYGTLGLPAPGNLPPARWSEAAWTDASGNFWFYGGNGLAADNTAGFPNDLWRYVPSNTVNLPYADFKFSMDQQSMTLLNTQSQTATIGIIGYDGFNSAITFSCSGLPAGATCAFSPSSLTPSQSGVAYIAGMTVTAGPTNTALHRNSSPFPLGATLAIFVFSFLSKKKRTLQLLLAVMAVTVFGALSGCGGPSDSLQPVTSTVTVTAASGSISHSTTFSLTVK